MLDLSKMTMFELLKLYYKLGFEIFKRTWWIWLIIIIFGITITYLQFIKGNYTRSGNCKECGKYKTFKSKYEFISKLKFNIWLFKHYKKEHNKNILFELSIFKVNKKYI